ncbi:unnamed protein product [Closterium sp. NIES-53]
MLAVASSTARRYHVYGSFSPPAVRIDGLDPSERQVSTVAMARFVSDPGALKSQPRVDASTAAAPADVAPAVAGAGTFLRPTPPRSPREGPSATLGFRHRRWHSFSGFQEISGECGVCGTPESLDGAYIYYPPRVLRPSTVTAAAASAAAAVSSSRLPTPAVAAQYPVLPAATAAATTSPPPAEAMWPPSQSHGSETLARRRLARHRRTRSVEAVMERSEMAGQSTSMGQASAMAPSCSMPFPRAFMAVQSPHGLRRARSAGKQSPCEAGTSFPKSPRSGPSSSSSASSSPSTPLSPPPLSHPPLSPPPLSPPRLSPPPLSVLSSSKPISPLSQSKPTSRSSRSRPVAGPLASGRYSIPDSFMQPSCDATSSSSPAKAAVGGGAASAACTSGDLKGLVYLFVYLRVLVRRTARIMLARVFNTIIGGSGSKLERALGDAFPEGERYFGLENFGNTCYCNSVLQALYFCVPFREHLLDYYAKHKPANESEETLLTCLAELFNQINSQKRKTGVIAPRRFVQRVKKQKELFRSYMHQDAHEFLNFLLNELVDILEKEARAGRAEAGRIIHPNLPAAAAAAAAPAAAPGASSGGGAVAAVRSEGGARGSEGAGEGREGDGGGASAAAAEGIPTGSGSSAASAAVAASVAAAATAAGVGVGGAAAGSAVGGGGGSGAKPTVVTWVHEIFQVCAAEGEWSSCWETAAVGSAGGGGGGSGVKPTVVTWVHEIFQGALTNEMRCLCCQTVTAPDEAFLDLSLEDNRAEQQCHHLPAQLLTPSLLPLPALHLPSLVFHIFQGTLTNEMRYLCCETVTARDEAFLDLSLDIEQTSRATSCLRNLLPTSLLPLQADQQCHHLPAQLHTFLHPCPFPCSTPPFPVSHAFQGTLTNETRCLCCETVTAGDEAFLDLSLDIEQNSSITSCLRNLLSSLSLPYPSPSDPPVSPLPLPSSRLPPPRAH